MSKRIIAVALLVLAVTVLFASCKKEEYKVSDTIQVGTTVVDVYEDKDGNKRYTMDVALDNVENNGENIMMNVVPNPFVDVVSVVLQGEDKKYSSYYLWIYDLSGNIVANFDLLDGRGEYNLSHLSSGVYYFALVTEDYQLEQYFKTIKQ